MDDDLHFEVKDFQGRIIRCTEVHWQDHILGVNHPYMNGAENDVVSALQHPEHGFRCFDRIYPNRRVYYKLSESKDYFIKVVVEFKDRPCNGTGYLVTAYMPDEMTDGEKPEI